MLPFMDTIIGNAVLMIGSFSFEKCSEDFFSVKRNFLKSINSNSL